YDQLGRAAGHIDLADGAGAGDRAGDLIAGAVGRRHGQLVGAVGELVAVYVLAIPGEAVIAGRGLAGGGEDGVALGVGDGELGGGRGGVQAVGPGGGAARERAVAVGDRDFL